MKRSKVSLIVNSSMAVNRQSNIQVNVTTKVNSQSIRREVHNGRDHLVLPSYTLPANVIMNGGLYTAEQIDAHYEGIEGTLAPLGHPVMNGEFISAFSAEGINQGHIGAWNRNVKKSGNRIYVEKWVDIQKANESEKGRELIERVEAIERGDDVPPIHTSIAMFLDQLEPNQQQRDMGADWVADIKMMDHDAILLHEIGAATPEQGVGLMVNADKATSLKPVVNTGVLVGESYRERERRLDTAAKEKFAPGERDHAWVADFTDSQAIVIVSGGDAKVYGYTSDGGKITFDDDGSPVQRTESWVAVVTNKLKTFFNPQEKSPAVNNQEGDMPLTKEEKEELFAEVGSAVAANVEKALTGVNEKIDNLQANTEKQLKVLTANHDAEETRKREAVKGKFGEAVANSLSGDALDDMFKQCGTAAPLAGNAATQQPESGAPDFNEYFPQ